MSYIPPLTVTPRLIDLVSRISEALGRWAAGEGGLSPQLRRENRIRSIHASLAIEANSLTLSQVTDIVAGRRVLGPPREIAEVRNAVVAYDLLESLDPASTADFLAAQRALLQGLAADAGKFRSGGVGVFTANSWSTWPRRQSGFPISSEICWVGRKPRIFIRCWPPPLSQTRPRRRAAGDDRAGFPEQPDPALPAGFRNRVRTASLRLALPF